MNNYDLAFEQIANAYPHEVYAKYPDRFWEYFHNKYPDITREEMENLLKQTELDPEFGKIVDENWEDMI